MKRKTQRKPLIFDLGDTKFRSTALGFLEANEVLMTYLPAIMALVGDFNSSPLKGEEVVAEEVDISKVFGKIDPKLITNVCIDLLHQTEFLDLEDNKYYVIDPDQFETISECLQVIWRVFQYNFPDFFGKGEDSVQEASTPQSLPVTPAQPLTLLQKAQEETS